MFAGSFVSRDHFIVRSQISQHKGDCRQTEMCTQIEDLSIVILIMLYPSMNFLFHIHHHPLPIIISHPPHLSVGLIDQHVSVPRLPRIHIQHGLIRLLHRPLLNPRLHLLLHCQLQHLLNLVRRPDSTPPNLTSLRNQAERIEPRQVVLRRADLDELSVGAEEHEVLLERHGRRGNSADDQVERLGVVGSPVLVVVCGDEVVDAHFLCVLSLGVRAGNGHDFVGTQGPGVQHTEVAQPAEADDANFLAGAATVLLERCVDGNPATEHGCRVFGGNVVGDLEDEVGWGAAVVGVSTVGLAAVSVFAVVRADHSVAAMVFHAVGALLAVRAKAGSTLGTDTNAVSYFDAALSLLTDFDGCADDLMADAARVHSRRPSGTEGVEVRTADAAVGDLDVDVGFFPGFWGVFFEDHFALDGLGALAQPALELVVGAHVCSIVSGGLSMQTSCSDALNEVARNVGYAWTEL